MLKTHSLALVALLMAAPASANVITDWDETALELIQGNAPAPPPQINPIVGTRILTIMHIAMFEAVNSRSAI
jgi:hypothetical protein